MTRRPSARLPAKLRKCASILLGAAWISAVAASAAAQAPEKFTLMLDWTPNPDHVGIYYGLKNGFYRQQGIEPEFQVPSNPADPIKLVALDKADLAISYEPELFLAQQEKLQVVAVAAIVPTPLNALIISPKSGIGALGDIEGHSVGVPGIPVSDAFFATMLRTAGLREDSVTKINVGFSLSQMLLTGTVDAIIGGFRNIEGVQIAQELGQEPLILPVSELGVPHYDELVLAANSRRLKEDPAYADRVRRFVAATMQGSDGARADPEGAIGIMKEVSQYAPRFLEVSVPATLALMKPEEGLGSGCMRMEQWRAFGDWMRTAGLIGAEPDAAAAFTNEYLPHPCR